MVSIETHIYGIYPKTEELRIRINRWERGRIPTKEISELLSKEKDVYYNLMKNSGITYFTDPLFNWYDILRPVALLSGATLGPLTRYKENNTFYRLPEFSQLKGIEDDISSGMELQDNPPLPLYQGSDQNGFSAFLPSPISFYRMAQVDDSISKEKFISGITENYLEIFRKLGIKRATLFESFEYNGDDLSFLDSLTGKLDVILVTEGEISDGIFKGLSGKPYSIVTGDVDNAEVAARYSLVPGIKAIDAHNTKLENEKSVKERAESVAAKTGSDTVLLANSDYLDFLPRSIADRKVGIMAGSGE